jgi:beta-galactosidase/beta-glucuronidase
MPSRFFYPRPEYPRPQRQRGTVEGYDWLNLNGPWQFRFDGRRLGVEEKWFLRDTPEWREQIIVPFCWESLAAWGEGDTAGNDNYYSTRVFRHPLEVTRANHRSAPRFEVGWYRRAVKIPQGEAWHGRRIILHVGAADFFTDCWCNGMHVGHHEGGYTPFEFDITDALVDSAGQRTALLVFRVEDPMDNAEQPVGKQWRWYTTTSGIWQTVYLEPRSEVHIKSFRIVTDIGDGSVQFDIETAHAENDCALEIEVLPQQQTAQKVVTEVRQQKAQLMLNFDSPTLWDPNSPNLYDVILRLRSGKRVVDTVRSYFGMRKIDFELAQDSGVPAALRINGVPRYLRGALYQSYFPEGVYTASSVDTLKDDILWAKRFGFNFLRVHIKVDDPLLLYWADRLGILLMADFPNFGEGGDTLLGRKRFETMMRETIERDFNHPSIFAWCLFNETWGFGGQSSFADKLHAPEQGAAVPSLSSAAPDLPSSVKTKRRVKGAARPGMSQPQRWVQEMWNWPNNWTQRGWWKI